MKFFSLACDCKEKCENPLIALVGSEEAIVMYRSRALAEIAATAFRSGDGRQPHVQEFEVKSV